MLDSALLASMFYGCEAWICRKLEEPQQLYISALKTLLGVRKTTPNDLCLTELGYPTARGFIRQIQQQFYRKIIAERSGMSDDPFITVWNMVKAAKTPGANYITELLAEDYPRAHDMNKICERIAHSSHTKPATYHTQMNPQQRVHPIYTTKTSKVPEYQRLAFTRLRLGAHSLAIEKGRWSRIPREDRKCECGKVQTESHILKDCSKSAQIRQQYPNIKNFDLPELFDDDYEDVCSFCYKCMLLY